MPANNGLFRVWLRFPASRPETDLQDIDEEEG